jgi:YVTN family beta-propeller protein
LVTEVPVGARPWGIALSPDGQRLYTANGSSNDVTVVDTSSLRVVKKIPVGQGPWGVVLSR